MPVLESIKWNVAQKLELRWWRSYLKNQKVEEYLEWKKKYWRDFLDEICWGNETNVNHRILDAGCGPAGIFMVLPPNELVALDPLIDQYQSDLAHFDKKMYPGVEFVSLPFEQYQGESQFEVIYCLNAVNHFRDFKGSISKLSDLLTPGGHLVLSIDVHRHKLLKYIFRLLPGDALHPQQHSRKDYLKTLNDGSLKLVKSIVKDKGFVFNYEVLVFKKRGIN